MASADRDNQAPACCVLVVEDNLGHAELLERSFEDAPEFALAVVETVRKAGDVIERGMPDLILTDYRLPDGEGRNILELVKGACPVLVMTSQGSEQIAVELMKAGALDYLVKSPAVFEGMPQIVRRGIREWRLQQAHRLAQEELARVNATLEQRVREEVAKNLEKDRLLAHQARLAAMGEMLRDIAHQWRQPLNNIAVILQSHYLEYLAGELTPTTCREHIDLSLEALSYLSHTIDEFRTFYQPDRAQQSFDLGTAVAAALQLVRPSMESHGIELRLHQAGTAAVYGFRNEFVNAVMNLLNNARDAIQEHKPANPLIEVRVGVEQQTAFVAVRDTGGGVGAEIADKIFDPYFTTKFKSQGTGIGLYMVRTIIESTMGGTVSVRNCDGGAEFMVRLPVHPADR